MDSSNDADRKLEPETTKKMRGDDSRSEDAGDDLQMSPGDKLCEDELTLIFSNSWISTQDLFNLRLVSKNWRDAATTTLLRRDACVVELYGDFNRNPPCFYKDGGKKTDENELSQLTEIFSKSKKFPSTNLRIQTSLNNFTRYTEFPDLLDFFKLHGDKIKTLRPHGWVTPKRLLDILLIHAPILEHLDLSEAEIRAPRQGKSRDGNALKWTSESLPMKSLTLSEFGARCHSDCDVEQSIAGIVRAKGEPCECMINATDRDLFHSFLLSSPSKLSRIENVILESLGMVLTQGKGHLIRSFKCFLEEDDENRFEDQDEDKLLSASFKEFVTLNPKLTKITLRFDCWYNSSPPKDFITSSNGLLESSKDTLQTLTFSLSCNSVGWGLLLSIPQMQKLNSLTLRFENWFEPDDEEEKSTCNRCGEDAKTNIDLREEVFKFEDGISAQNYFPNLMEVALYSRYSDYHEFSPMSFFSFKVNADTDGIPDNWSCLPKVDILKINKIEIGLKPISCRSCQPPRKPVLFSEVFPNIQILKLECGDVSNLSNSLWTFCPNVEFMEIYDIFSYLSDGRDLKISSFVDKVFTGFSDEMLENLQKSAADLSCAVDDSLEWKPKPAPTTPSISDLKRLKELKLKFVWNWSTEFASYVTGVHAFSKMENTKFIISYDPEQVLDLNQDHTKVSCSNDDEEEDESSDSDDDNADGGNMGHKNIGDDDGWREIDEDIDEANDSADSDDDNGGADLQYSDVDNDDDENTGYENDGDDDGRNQIVANIDEAKDSELNGNDEIAKYEQLIFGSIKLYVHIVHERQKVHLWDDNN